MELKRKKFKQGLLSILGFLGGEGFNTDLLPLQLVIKCFLIQKVFGINRRVSWPVDWTSKVICPAKITRGTRFPGLSKGCHIDGRNGIIFGDNVWVGPGAKIISMNHSVTDFDFYETSPPIVIGNDCWIASDAKILAGVTIGNHTIVSTGAVVTKSFPEVDQLLGGVPAKVIKMLPPYSKRR